jgi:hypothetical protein
MTGKVSYPIRNIRIIEAITRPLRGGAVRSGGASSRFAVWPETPTTHPAPPAGGSNRRYARTPWDSSDEVPLWMG